MTKFRKWLIHKLGGFTKEDNIPKPKIIYQNDKLVQICVRQVVWSDKDNNLYIPEKILKKELKHRLVDVLEPEYTLNEGKERLVGTTSDSFGKNYVSSYLDKQYFMEAKLWVPSRYVKTEAKENEN